LDIRLDIGSSVGLDVRLDIGFGVRSRRFTAFSRRNTGPATTTFVHEVARDSSRTKALFDLTVLTTPLPLSFFVRCDIGSSVGLDVRLDIGSRGFTGTSRFAGPAATILKPTIVAGHTFGAETFGDLAIFAASLPSSLLLFFYRTIGGIVFGRLFIVGKDLGTTDCQKNHQKHRQPDRLRSTAGKIDTTN
jgi:hypothetical protein